MPGVMRELRIQRIKDAEREAYLEWSDAVTPFLNVESEKLEAKLEVLRRQAKMLGTSLEEISDTPPRVYDEDPEGIYDVPCRTCGAKSGEHCRTIQGSHPSGKEKHTPHANRVRDKRDSLAN